MSIARAVARGRRAAEARMKDTCAITRVTGRVMGDDDKYVDETTTVYTGTCRVKIDRVARQVEAGETAVEIQRIVVELPFATDVPVERGDTVHITESEDAWAVGRTLDVDSVNIGEQVTARRLMVHEAS